MNSTIYLWKPTNMKGTDWLHETPEFRRLTKGPVSKDKELTDTYLSSAGERKKETIICKLFLFLFE